MGSMSDDAPKSAYELAMQRLRRQDAEAGVEERAVNETQKAEMDEVKRVYSARIAQAEILHKSSALTVFDPEERSKLDQGHRREVERLREEQEKKLQRIRDTA